MSELLKTIRAVKHLFSFLVFDIGGNRITTASGKILYEDDRFARLAKGGKGDKNNWEASCPAPRLGQKAELWDLVVGGQPPRRGGGRHNGLPRRRGRVYTRRAAP